MEVLEYYSPNEEIYAGSYEIIHGKKVGEPDYELIRGEKIYMAAEAPSISHGIIVARLGMIFSNYIEEKNFDAFVIAANSEVHFSKDCHYKPDVSIVMRKPNVLEKEKFIDGSPDLVVEVISESSKKYDIGVKKEDYERFGVKEYWIVDPDKKSIEVYHNVDGKFNLSGEYKIHSENTLIKVSIFNDLIVDVHKVFKWWLN
ncbi:MAG: Uma2 family endonuclease [Selenomonadaceae bacterium]|nr:Uma2 family endonuclease [Selenomonadaceae bacterium]